jgi:hypothetical protein
MLSFFVSVVLASSTCDNSNQICIERNPIKDIPSFIALYIAAKECPGITINGQKALEQAGDAAQYITSSFDLAANMVNSIGNALTEYSAKHPEIFCAESKKTLDSYSHEYLKWYAIID